MSSRILTLFCLATAVAHTACAKPQVQSAPPAGTDTQPPAAVVQQTAVSTANPAELLPNGKMPLDGVLVGGQPTPEQFRVLAGLGYGTIINLRTPEEDGTTDPSLIESLGMEYISLPIGGADTLNEENARQLGILLESADSPVVVHCASGNRVGALFALKAFYVDGRTPDEALELGKQAGVTRLEPVVRQKLGLE